jgi:ech hydrogenase subunit D
MAKFVSITTQKGHSEMREEVADITLDTLLGEVAKAKAHGYRFVTLSCVEVDENTVDIFYHFDKDLVMKHYRLTVPKSAAVHSISAVYFAAFLVENEIQDLFGIRFSGLAVDYQGTFYLEEEVRRTPFCKYSIATAKPCASASTVDNEMENASCSKP